jgi:hypothetical protein
MKTLKVFQTNQNGTVLLGKDMAINVTITEEGKFLIPLNEAQEKALLEGPGLGRMYWEVDKKDVKKINETLLYQILSKEKVERLFNLNDAKRAEALKLINDNFDEVMNIVMGISAPKAPDSKTPGNAKAPKTIIPFDDITIPKLKEILDEEEIPYDQTAKKAELYLLAFPEGIVPDKGAE